MSAETDAFAALKAEKDAAKDKSLQAVGEAKLAEKEGRDAEPFWAIVAEQGASTGVEGKKAAEMQTYADVYCLAHPEVHEVTQRFAAGFRASDPELDELASCVRVVDMYRLMGQQDAVIEAEMYMLHRFERQDVGGRVRARIRMPGGQA